jgi:prepilin-type N-terminal cleavage/methylation domain-containing protein
VRHRSSGSTVTHRSGYTLLELMIAVGLSAILMASLYKAMDIYLSLQLDSHEEISRQQVARAVLRQMTRDIQSVVFTKQEALPEEDEDIFSMSDSGSSGLSGAGTSGLSGNGMSGLGGTGTSSAGSSSAAELDGNSYGSSTIDPETVSTTYTSGLVGTSTDLQLFISRPDRNLAYVSAQELTSPQQRTGDLLLVRYLLASKLGSGLGSMIADREAAGNTDGPIGLARVEGDLYGLSTAVETAEDLPQLSAAKLIAREVSSVVFRYYDGGQWLDEWDSTARNELPKAIEIVITIRDEQPTETLLSDDEQTPYAFPETTHRMVVPLPTAEPFVMEALL